MCAGTPPEILVYPPDIQRRIQGGPVDGAGRAVGVQLPPRAYDRFRDRWRRGAMLLVSSTPRVLTLACSCRKPTPHPWGSRRNCGDERVSAVDVESP